MADALGRPFVRVALGGVRDEAEIRGHRRTYVGALPGRILAAMRRAECRNPLLLLDEIDKLGRDGNGDPAAALLEVLDPEQQGTFSDHYLEVPFDLSQVLWVATANDLGAMPAPLRDRLEVVVLPPYGPEEKASIAARHLIPRQAALHALPPGALSLTHAAVRALVRRQGAEPGLRGLERQVAALCRKAARLVLTDPGAQLRVTGSNLDALLDPAGGDPGPPA
jgi:ATP-dependent Lon protease